MPSSDMRPALPALDGEGPLWQQIRRALEQPILRGDWRPGTLIPTELQLTAAYGTARMTVSRALRSLADDGHIERRRKRGSLVAMAAPDRPVFEIWDVQAEIERSGAAYAFDLFERVALASDDPRRADLSVGSDAAVLWLVGLHRADGEPVQFEERVINLAAAPGAADESFKQRSPGRWLLETVPWSEAEHIILAEPAPRAIARHLAVRLGAACLVVERHTWNRDVPVTFVRLWQSGKQRRLTGRFTRKTG